MIVELSKEDLERCSSFSERVHSLKNSSSTTLLLRQNSHEIGKLGELVFYKAQLIPLDEPDFEVKKKGDAFDFNCAGLTIDVKTTTYFEDPLLKEFINPKRIPDIYVLVALDVKNKGSVVGFIESKEFLTEKYFVRYYKNLGNRYLAKKEDLRTDWEFFYEGKNFRQSDGNQSLGKTSATSEGRQDLD